MAPNRAGGKGARREPHHPEALRRPRRLPDDGRALASWRPQEQPKNLECSLVPTSPGLPQQGEEVKSPVSKGTNPNPLSPTSQPTMASTSVAPAQTRNASTPAVTGLAETPAVIPAAEGKDAAQNKGFSEKSRPEQAAQAEKSAASPSPLAELKRLEISASEAKVSAPPEGVDLMIADMALQAPNPAQTSKAETLSIGDFDKKLRQMQMDTHLRFNQMTQNIEYKGVALGPLAYEKLLIAFSNAKANVSKQSIMDVASVMGKSNSYDPVKEYLTQLEGDAEVTPADIEWLATTYLGTTCDFANRVLKAVLVGAVKRRFEPGCQFELVMIIKGAQGIGKSRFWEYLASSRFYSCSPAAQDRDLLAILQGVWIYEIAECEALFSTKSAGKIKNLISTSSDQYRPAYARDKQTVDRSSIFVGTVNEEFFLNDPTGSRRYVVIEVQGEIPIKQVKADRDQIWKAAMAAYRAGEPAKLSRADAKHAELLNKAHELEDPWISKVEAWLERNPDINCFATSRALTEAQCRSETSISKSDAMRMAKQLKELGWVRDNHQSGPTRERLWRRPAQPVAAQG